LSSTSGVSSPSLRLLVVAANSEWPTPTRSCTIPFVQVRGGPTTLSVGSLDRAAQQRLALTAPPLQLAGQRPGKRELDEMKGHESRDEWKRERAPEVASGRGDGAVALIRLEQQLPPVGRCDGNVDLAKLPGGRSKRSRGGTGRSRPRPPRRDAEPLAHPRQAGTSPRSAPVCREYTIRPSAVQILTRTISPPRRGHGLLERPVRSRRAAPGRARR
jgi:hypothetical protein